VSWLEFSSHLDRSALADAQAEPILAADPAEIRQQRGTQCGPWSEGLPRKRT
jgi:hypothetical protein